MSEVWLTVAWCVTVFLFMLSGFFSGAETAIMSVNQVRLRGLVDQGDGRARIIEKLREDTSRLLSTILLGNNFANVVLASLATTLAVPIWGNLASLYVGIILTPLLLVFCEIVPKTLASRRSMAVARLVAPPLAGFTRLMSPLIWVTSRAAAGVLRLLRLTEHEKEVSVTAEDLKTMATVGREEGSLGAVTHDILHGLYDFTSSSVRDVMVPRHEIVSMPLDAGVAGFRDVVSRHGHTRVPVWGDNDEDIVGILHAKDLLHRPGRPGPPADIRETLRPAVFVPELTTLGRTLRRMQDSASEMVFVVDEYGGLEGLVTLKDIIEELVGDIEDEHDKARNRRVDLIRPGTVICDANVTLRYLKRQTGLDLRPLNEDARTVGGLLVALAPDRRAAGDKIDLDGATFTVLAADGRFLKKVRIDWHPERPPGA